jgi:hypothetical protein
MYYYAVDTLVPKCIYYYSFFCSKRKCIITQLIHLLPNVSITTVFFGSKRECNITQLIHLLLNVSITAAFFITIYYLQSLCGKLLYQLLSTQDFQLI